MRQGRPLEGTLTVLGVGWLAAVAVILLYGPPLSLGAVAILGGGAALCSALAEIFTGPVDDNFTIPLAAAIGVNAAAFLAGIAGV